MGHTVTVETERDSFQDLQTRMRVFAQERDWEQFQDPKSLLLALVGEVGELAELFQWLPADTAKVLVQDPELKARVGEEISDVLLYLLRFADVLGVDVSAAAHSKMDANEIRFPTTEFHGDAPVKS